MPDSDTNNVAPALAALPSASYETARGTLVYRLSELVFGSLLAAYILGFASFGASALVRVNTSPFVDLSNLNRERTWSLLLTTTDIFTFAAVSATYAYLTAAMYLRYHTGILTMPTAAVERSRFDFGIAVSQAILFGVSMFSHQWHFLFIAVILRVAIFRQNREFAYLATHLTNQIVRRTPQLADRPRPPVDPATVFAAKQAEEQAEEILRERVTSIIANSEMPGWRPVSRAMRFGVYALIIIGLIALALPSVLSSLSYPVSNEWLRVGYGGASIGLFLLVLRGTLDTMRQGSRFIHNEGTRKALDAEYLKLEKELLDMRLANGVGR